MKEAYSTSIPANFTSFNGTKSESAGVELYALAEKRLRELIEAGNIEAIKLAMDLNPQKMTVTW